MPKPGVDPLIGDAEDLSSWRERMRRWAIRDLKNQDIADIFLEDGEYPEYEEPQPNLAAYAQGGFHKDAEKLRYSLELTDYNENKLFSTILGQHVPERDSKGCGLESSSEGSLCDGADRGDIWCSTIHRSWHNPPILSAEA